MQLVWELDSHCSLDFLNRTCIDKLIPDPNLSGAGIHKVGRGGFLKVQADFATHRDFALGRRLNFLLYLYQDWPEKYGGHLELWDKHMQGLPKDGQKSPPSKMQPSNHEAYRPAIS